IQNERLAGIEAMAIEILRIQWHAGYAVFKGTSFQRRRKRIVCRGREDGQTASIAKDRAELPVLQGVRDDLVFHESEAGLGSCIRGRDNKQERLVVTGEILILL